MALEIGSNYRVNSWNNELHEPFYGKLVEIGLVEYLFNELTLAPPAPNILHPALLQLPELILNHNIQWRVTLQTPLELIYVVHS